MINIHLFGKADPVDASENGRLLRRARPLDLRRAQRHSARGHAADGPGALAGAVRCAGAKGGAGKPGEIRGKTIGKMRDIWENWGKI